MKLYRLLLVGLIALAGCAQQGASNSTARVAKGDEALLLPRVPLAGWTLVNTLPVVPEARIDSRAPFGGGDFSWIEPTIDGGLHVLRIPQLANIEYRRSTPATDVQESKLVMIVPALPERGAALMARIVARCPEPNKLFDVPTSYERVNGYSSTVRTLTCKENGKTVTRTWQIIDGVDYSFILSQVAIWQDDGIPLRRFTEVITDMLTFLSGGRPPTAGVAVCDFVRTADRCKAVEHHYHVFRNQKAG